MRYLTVGSCLKNEESYMEDFIKYHRFVGVEHFVFLDREYSPLSELLAGYSDVEIIHYPEVAGNTHQMAWAKLIEHNKGKTKWLACIDADQALVPANDVDVKDILREYEEFAGLYINAWTFGTNGHQIRIPGSVYERFTSRAAYDYRDNRMVQFIVQPDKAHPIPAGNPHTPILHSNEVIVNTDKKIIGDLSQIYPIYDKLWLAHYVLKSIEEWHIKVARGRADILGAKMSDQQFHQYLDNCDKEQETRVAEIWQKAKT